MAAPGPGALVPAGGVVQRALSPATPNTNQMLVLTNQPSPDPEYVWVRLSDQGNIALWSLCFTAVQREVWSWPSYDFLVKVKRQRGVLKLVIRAEQVSLYRTSALSFSFSILIIPSSFNPAGRRT